MPAPYVVSLSVVVGLVLASRILVPGLPWRPHAGPLTVFDAAVLVIGLAGLAFHCGSMFFTSIVDAIPGTARAISEINAMGTASKVGYAVPAALVVVGFRHQHPAALGAVAAALLAVGVTMYDGGSLFAHLTAIFIAVLAIAGVVSVLARPEAGARSRRQVTAVR
ncbi:MAG TPA: hypothetical protein VFE55_02010 [Acidimicrobiia bacterium]|nr:hypothetical protein [Acidimicrobiia bacterium]